MKYIALDLDGTLLNSNHEISKTTKDYLIEIQQQGHKVILCSGRSYFGIRDLADELKIKEYGGYIVSYNGGSATCPRKEKELFTNNFTVSEVRKLYEALDHYAENFVTYGHGTINCKVPNHRIETSSKIMNAEITTDILVNSPKVVLQDEVETISAIYPKVKDVVREIDSTYNVFRSVPHLIEITPYNSDKASGLKKLFEVENLDLDSLIAFGDGENDLTMLEFAHVGVAMGNAMDEVKNVADLITDTNDNDGIVLMLKELLSNEGEK